MKRMVTIAMSKDPLIALSVAVLFLVLPFQSYAAIATDASSYPNPATVMYGGFSSGRNLVLYQPSDTTPSCVQTAGTATSSLNTLCSGIFTGTIGGSYTIVQPTLVGCETYTLSQCQAANVSMPGANQADFTIADAPPTPVEATSTPDQVQQNLYNGFMIFLLTFGGVVFFFRRGS